MRNEETRVAHVAQAARAFARALHAKERLALLDQSRELASRLLAAVRRRGEAGESSRLEVEVGRASERR